MFYFKLYYVYIIQNEWDNLHIKALRILCFAAENPIIVDKLIEIESIPQILNYIEHVATPKLFVEALRVIVHIANTSNGRKVILYNIYILRYVKEEHYLIFSYICVIYIHLYNIYLIGFIFV